MGVEDSRRMLDLGATGFEFDCSLDRFRDLKFFCVFLQFADLPCHEITRSKHGHRSFCTDIGGFTTMG